MFCCTFLVVVPLHVFFCQSCSRRSTICSGFALPHEAGVIMIADDFFEQMVEMTELRLLDLQMELWPPKFDVFDGGLCAVDPLVLASIGHTGYSLCKRHLRLDRL